MRNIQTQRDLGVDGRALSIRKVNTFLAGGKKVTFLVERPESGGSTVFGPATTLTVGTFTGRFDQYAIARSSSGEKRTDAGEAASARARIEVPFPTDENGVEVDINRGDRVTVDGVSFRVTNIADFPGFIECLLEFWS